MERPDLSAGMKRFLPLLLIALLLTGCYKDKFDLDKMSQSQWKPSIAAPVATASLGVYDILARQDSNNLVVIDENTGQVALVYDGEMLSYDGSDVVDLPGDDFSPENVPYSTPPGGGTHNTSLPPYTISTTSGVQIDSAMMKNGDLGFSVSSNFSYGGDITLTIPGLTQGGQSFSKTFSVPGGGSVNKSYDISGHTWDLTDGGSTSNEINVDVTLAMNNPSGGNDNGNMEIITSLSGLEYKEAYGDLGNQTITFSEDSILLEVFRNSAPGVFQLTSSSLELDIINSFGFPVSFTFDQLRAINYNTGAVTPLNYTGGPTTLDHPDYSEVGESKTTEVKIDSTNSNIHTEVNNTPKWIHHAVSGSSNPSSSGHDDFITDESEIRVQSYLRLPLKGYAHSWSITDTVDFSFGEGGVENVEKLLIRSIVDNGFPVDVEVQLYLTDEDTVVIDSLYPQGERQIVSGITDSEGKVTESTRKITDLEFADERLEHLQEAKYMIVTGTAQTDNATSGKEVNIFDSYTMEVKLGIKVNGRFSF